MPDPRIHPIKTADDTFVTVGAASTQVRPATMNRAELDLVNDSTQSIYLGFGNDAVIGSGKRLNPAGGAYHMGPENLFHGTINAICVDGDANLCVSEGLV